MVSSEKSKSERKIKLIGFRPTEEECDNLNDVSPSPSEALHIVLRVIPILKELNRDIKKAIPQVKEIMPEWMSLKQQKIWENTDKSLKCDCEGCRWYDGWDSKRNIPRCLHRNPPIDKKSLSKTSGKLCQELQEEMTQLQKTMGRTVTPKNLGIVLAMAKKLNVTDAELTEVKKDKAFLENEVKRKRMKEHTHKLQIEINGRIAKEKGITNYKRDPDGRRFFFNEHQAKIYIDP